MLKQLCQFREVETLIPNTGTQYLDVGFNVEALRTLKIRRDVWPRIRPGETDTDGRPVFDLEVVERNEDEDYFVLSDDDSPPRFVDHAQEVFSVDADKAIDAYARVWIPVPFFRRRETAGSPVAEFYDGPTDWARAYITPLDNADREGNTHRITLAFDTQLVPRRSGGSYAAPEPDDAEQISVFALASHPLAARQYFAHEWVKAYLREAFVRNLSIKRGKVIHPDDLHNPEKFPRLGDYLGTYLVLMEGIGRVCPPPTLRFVDTVKLTMDHPVDVDLILDIGNSRTCGMYVEQNRDQDRGDISSAQRLELRDLTEPSQVYTEPFQSVVEFYPASFGFDDIARRSRRPKRPSFYWPSPVRVGPEAARLAVASDGKEGVSGMSSPKRYLWDAAGRVQPWTNNPSAPRPRGATTTPPIKGPFLAFLTEEGALVSRSGGDIGLEPRYSRASMFALMLAEILLHAIGQINSVAIRAQKRNADLPRRLRKVVLTLPSATPVAEQRAMKRLAEDALELVWKSMSWPTRREVRQGKADPGTVLFEQPYIHLEWDEASCTHLVYLYNEIHERFRGAPDQLISMMGRGRATPTGPALRIASIDIGGGTSDLMIIQHEVESFHIVHPRQLFREGFRQAGDDIVKSVAEHCVVPAIVDALERAGATNAQAMMSRLFGGDREEQTVSMRTRRALFVNQIIAPAAIGLLSLFEQADLRRPEPPRRYRVRELLKDEAQVSDEVAQYLHAEARMQGARDFDVMNVDIEYHVESMRQAVIPVLRSTLEHLCDIVREYDCDLLLLTGRPSRLPVVLDLVLGEAPVPIDRVIALHQYEIGSWYPFRSDHNRITDPKTTAAVGAMLCQTCEGGAENFFMRSSELRMWSTARYIGPIDHDRIREDRVCQQDLDPANVMQQSEFSVQMSANFFLGFRQLPIERWPASPLVFVSFRQVDGARRLEVPLTVHFERRQPRDDEDIDQLNEVMESFRIALVEDRNGDEVPAGTVSARLQTLRIEWESGGGYWLDTGILDTQQRTHGTVA